MPCGLQFSAATASPENMKGPDGSGLKNKEEKMEHLIVMHELEGLSEPEHLGSKKNKCVNVQTLQLCAKPLS